MSPSEVIPLNAGAGGGADVTSTADAGPAEPPSRQDHAAAKAAGPLWDPPFERSHQRLKRLSDHVLQVTTSFDDQVQEAARLGELNLIEFAALPSRGRRATGWEWTQVEQRTHTIWAALSEPQRRKFITTQVPGWFSYLLSALLFLVIASVYAAYIVRFRVDSPVPGDLLMPFMFFVIGLGAIGATASIGMNALSLQDDATFDISSGKFLWLRLLLGALFGAMLTFPWGFPVFKTFIGSLLLPASQQVQVTQTQLYQSIMLLMPFVLGFSTSLVILVLSRAVESVQTFFGKISPANGQHK